jgi:hypothetical protein
MKFGLQNYIYAIEYSIFCIYLCKDESPIFQLKYILIMFQLDFDHVISYTNDIFNIQIRILLNASLSVDKL